MYCLNSDCILNPLKSACKACNSNLSSNFGLTSLLPSDYADELHTKLINLFNERHWAITDAVQHISNQYEIKLNQMLSIEMEQKNLHADFVGIIKHNFKVSANDSFSQSSSTLSTFNQLLHPHHSNQGNLVV